MIPDTAYTGSTNAYAPTPTYHKSADAYATSKPATGGKPQGIISMILGIEGLISGIVAIICAFALLDTPKEISRSYGYGYYYGSYSYEYDNPLFELLATYAITFSITAIISAIIAVCLGFASSRRGNTSKLPTLGKVFSFITFGLSALALIITMSEL